MKKHPYYFIFLGILTFVFLLTAAFISFRMVAELKAFIENKYQYSEILNLEKRLLDPAALMSNQGMDPEMKASAQKALNQAESHYQSAVRYGWLLALCALVFGVALLLTSLKKPYFKKALTFGLVIISLFFHNMNVGIDTETQILLGLYFFFSYVMGSLLSSLCIEWALESSPKEEKK